MVVNILPPDPHPPTPPLTLRIGSKGHISTFSEHGHVAYQIKENQVCSNMVAIILPVDPTPDLGGQKVKIQLFQNMVMLHIKLKGTSNMVANILLAAPPPPPPPPTPLPPNPGSKGQNSTFSEHGHVAYQIKGNNECSNMVANVLLANIYPSTPPPAGWVKRSKFNFFKPVYLTHTHIIWVRLKSDIENVQVSLFFN